MNTKKPTAEAAQYQAWLEFERRLADHLKPLVREKLQRVANTKASTECVKVLEIEDLPKAPFPRGETLTTLNGAPLFLKEWLEAEELTVTVKVKRVWFREERHHCLCVSW